MGHFHDCPCHECHCHEWAVSPCHSFHECIDCRAFECHYCDCMGVCCQDSFGGCCNCLVDVGSCEFFARDLICCGYWDCGPCDCSFRHSHARDWKELEKTNQLTPLSTF